MNSNNNVARVRREILAEVARLALEGRLAEGSDRIAYEMTGPGWETVRCCIHHDRAILRLRIMAALGADPAGLDDVDRPLADYANAAIDRAKGAAGREGKILTVMDEACNACVKTRYLVTEACQGCLARPCKMNCPKGAIAFNKGRAHIDTDKCVNCGLCMKNCPYTSIVKLPVPCEEACPVAAISKGEDGVERIDESKCILCGKCLKECPFGAVVELSDIVGLALDLAAGKPLVALVAPAVAVQFPGGWGKLEAGLKRLGFTAIVEVAKGAEGTARDEAAELAERRAEGQGFLATSCCPSWVEALHKHLGPIEEHLSSTPSPMVYAAQIAAERYPDSGRVFLGPCVAKRGEARRLPLVDRVVTAEELGALFVAADIDLGALEALPDSEPAAQKARGFASSGGVAAAVLAVSEGGGGTAPRTLAVNGITKQGMKLMETWAARPPEADLVEVMACEGGCVGGPCAIATPRLAQLELAKFVAGGKE